MSHNLTPEFRRRPTADGCDTLYSARYGQSFHSKYGALLEAEHVFLTGTGVKARLAAGQATTVLEVGFGTGLNFLLTAGHSQRSQTLLRYVALEETLLPVELLAQLNHGQQVPAIADLRQAFLAWRRGLPGPSPAGTFRWHADRRIVLDLIVGDATGVKIPQRGYQAIYHDPFSPDANPELWTPEFFAQLFEVLVPGGNLATYSAKGSVRRNLQAAGFQVQKLPGPPGKREMMVALRQNAAA